jgi:TolA-binding protein
MEDIFEANAPTRFPSPKEQPDIPVLAEEGEKPQGPPMKINADRWKKEIIDKIQYLKENLELAQQDKEALSLEVDKLQEELRQSKGKIQELEVQLAEALDTFNALLNEVSQALGE